MSQPLTLKIPIKNRHGEVVGEKEVVSYAGLLAKAHDEGLEGISTELVQVPTETNGSVAIVRATITGRRGTFTGLGDADPSNVNRGVVRHLLRIAETRAKARALRDYVDVGTVSLEELGGEDDDCVPEEPVRHGEARSVAESVDTSGPCSDAQRRLLWRLALTLGYEGEAASTFLADRLGIRDGRMPTKREASRLIDELDAEARRSGHPGNGGGRHAA